MAHRGALTGNVGREPDVRNLPSGVAQTGSMEHSCFRPPPSSPWSRLATSGAASSSLPTRASASGANCSATPSSPRQYWTGCCTTATCSTSGAKDTGSRTSAKRGCSRRNNIWLLPRKGPATTTPTDKVAGHQRCGSGPTHYKWLISNTTTTVLETTEWVDQPAQPSSGNRRLAFSCWNWGVCHPSGNRRNQPCRTTGHSCGTTTKA